MLPQNEINLSETVKRLRQKIKFQQKEIDKLKYDLARKSSLEQNLNNNSGLDALSKAKILWYCLVTDYINFGDDMMAIGFNTDYPEIFDNYSDPPDDTDQDEWNIQYFKQFFPRILFITDERNDDGDGRLTVAYQPDENTIINLFTFILEV